MNKRRGLVFRDIENKIIHVTGHYEEMFDAAWCLMNEAEGLFKIPPRFSDVRKINQNFQGSSIEQAVYDVSETGGKALVSVEKIIFKKGQRMKIETMFFMLSKQSGKLEAHRLDDRAAQEAIAVLNEGMGQALAKFA